MDHLKRTRGFTLYFSALLLLFVFQFQNCSRSQFTKVGQPSTTIADSMELCEGQDCNSTSDLIPDDGDGGTDDPNDGEQPDDSTGGGDDGTGDQPDDSTGGGDDGTGDQPDDSTGGGDDGTGDQPDDSTGGGDDGTGDQPDDSIGDGDNNDDLVIVSCKSASKSTFIDAVMIVDSLILTSPDGSETLEVQGELSLSGFELEIPEELQGLPLSLKLNLASEGHYFVTSNDEKVLMNKLPSHLQHNSKTRLRIAPTEISEGLFLIEVDWQSRVFPSPNFCGLLPLTSNQ